MTDARETHKRLADHYAKTDTRPEPQTIEQQVAALEGVGAQISPSMRTRLGYARGQLRESAIIPKENDQ